MTRRIALSIALLLTVGAAFGPRPEARQAPVAGSARSFRSGVELTAITATVTDQDGHLVTGLPREAFEVYEDGDRQTLTQFSNERVPISLGVLLDTSDSMFGRRLADARQAVERFLFDLLTRDDDFFVLAFNHTPHVLTTWTRDPAVVHDSLAALKPFGGTAEYDAIVAALPMLERRANARAALVVISDGADTASTATLRSIRTDLHKSDAFVYAVALDSPDPQPINTRVNVQALRELTGESGGRTEVVTNSADIIQATARIAEELNSQYLIGFTSARAADGLFHSLRVRVAGRSDYKVRARNGYLAARKE